MSGLSRAHSAGTMDFGTGLCWRYAVSGTSRIGDIMYRREFVSVTTANLSNRSGAGKSFQ
jgi:hypothetical protein